MITETLWSCGRASPLRGGSRPLLGSCTVDA